MVKKRERAQESTFQRPKRAKLSGKESLKRMREFSKRKENFIAAVRKGKNRSVSA